MGIYAGYWLWRSVEWNAYFLVTKCRRKSIFTFDLPRIFYKMSKQLNVHVEYSMFNVLFQGFHFFCFWYCKECLDPLLRQYAAWAIFFFSSLCYSICIWYWKECLLRSPFASPINLAARHIELPMTYWRPSHSIHTFFYDHKIFTSFRRRSNSRTIEGHRNIE